MSRSYRGRDFVPRWGLTTLSPAKQDKAGQVAYLNRVVKRMNKAAGYATEKQPHEWHWRDVNDIENKTSSEPRCSVVVAHTKSEARALVKQALGISKNKRLPKSVEITKGDVWETE